MQGCMTSDAASPSNDWSWTDWLDRSCKNWNHNFSSWLEVLHAFQSASSSQYGRLHTHSAPVIGLEQHSAASQSSLLGSGSSAKVEGFCMLFGIRKIHGVQYWRMLLGYWFFTIVCGSTDWINWRLVMNWWRTMREYNCWRKIVACYPHMRYYITFCPIFPSSL